MDVAMVHIDDGGREKARCYELVDEAPFFRPTMTPITTVQNSG